MMSSGRDRFGFLKTNMAEAAEFHREDVALSAATPLASSAEEPRTTAPVVLGDEGQEKESGEALSEMQDGEVGREKGSSSMQPVPFVF